MGDVNLSEEVLNVLKGSSVDEATIKVFYTNYRGEKAERKIIPLRTYYGENEYHKEKQWILVVWDLDKNDYREYAFKDIVWPW